MQSQVTSHSLANGWQSYNDQFLYLNGKISTNKIAAFDLDGTLIVYRNGHDPVKYNTVEENNWQFLGPIKNKIIELSKDYTIFIITNQLNLSQSKKNMISLVWNALDRIPFVLCAHKKNEYRKPNTTFMNVINSMLYSNGLLQKNTQLQFDIKESFYCGDAVGINDPFVPYRWSSDDYQFSVNCGLKFIRPIDLFGCSNVIPTQDIVIMMGTPGSLKTTFAKLLENNFGYIRLSQDEVGDLSKKLSYVYNGLMEGQKFVLDATFAKFQNRQPWLEIAQRLNKTVMIAWIIRDGRLWNKLRPNPISHFAYDGPHGYCKNFNDPELNTQGYKYVLEKIY